MSVWAEAWDLPHLADPGKKIAFLPILDYRAGRHADAFREEGAVKVPVAYNRLDEVHFVDPDDHSNDVGSVIHIYQRGVVGADGRPNPPYSFVTERRPDDLQSRATSVTDISGRGLTSYFLDRMKLLPYDYPANPTVQGDWNFGAPEGGGLLSDPGFENPPMPNGGFELGNLDNWSNTGVGGGAIVVTNDPGGAFDGDFYGICAGIDDAGAGWKYSFTGAYPGKEYTITGKIKQASGTGDRYRAGVSDATSASHANAYEEDGYQWAEVDNVAQGAGAGDGTWQDFTLTFIAATTGFELIIEYADAGAGSDFYIDFWDALGFGLGLTPWRPFILGFTEIFETQTTIFRSGERALRTQSTDFVYTNPYTGQQGWGRTGPTQTVSVVVGKRYTGTAWVRQDSGSPKSFIIIFRRVTLLGAIGSPGSSYLESRVVADVPSGVWTPFEVSEISDTDQLMFQVRWLYEGAFDALGHQSPVWFVDDTSMWEGEAAIAIGAVWLRIIGDRLAWLVPTFTATEDSNGDPWDTERSFTLTEGDSWGQIAESFQRLWGYVHRIRFDREDNTYYFDIFNPGYIHFDHSTTDSGSLIRGMNVLGGETVSRTPDATSWRIKGENGIWVEDTDTVLEDQWGESDMYLSASKVGSTVDLQDVLTQAMGNTLDQMITFQAQMNDQSQVVPGKTFDIFDLVNVNLGESSSIPSGDRLVTSIVISGQPGSPPGFQVYVNSDAFASTGAAALAEAVRRLLRKRPLEAPDDLALGGGEGGIGGDPTILLAPSDANQYTKDMAHMTMPGVNDHLVIQWANEQILTLGVRGRIVVGDGTVHANTDEIVLGSLYVPVKLHGLGKAITLFSMTGDGKHIASGGPGSGADKFTIIQV